MGPLQGIRIIEFAGLGPGPFCGMMLADHGADVIRVDRATGGDVEDAAHRILNRSRKSVRVDLKSAAGLELVRRLCRSADGLIEGFRPGVMERLGLGPDVLLADNPKLVYGRMTGWGQTGPYAQTAGHDINYIALSGALHACGRAGERPVAPLNLVGDFGGGGMMLAFGMVSALLHARIEGRGQVIDSAMTDGSAVLMSMIYSLRAAGLWRDERGVNLLSPERRSTIRTKLRIASSSRSGRSNRNSIENCWNASVLAATPSSRSRTTPACGLSKRRIFPLTS